MKEDGGYAEISVNIQSCIVKYFLFLSFSFVSIACA
jgi:hypothetical protein